MKKRLYISINFNHNVINQLENDINQLKRASSARRYTSSVFFHLTLTFIGNSDESLVPTIIEALQTITFNPFTITLDCLSMFQDDNRNIFYRSVVDNESLNALQKQITNALMNKKIPFSNKSFVPHVTLARDVVLNYPIDFNHQLDIHVDSFHLMESKWEHDECLINCLYTNQGK